MFAVLFNRLSTILQANEYLPRSVPRGTPAGRAIPAPGAGPAAKLRGPHVPSAALPVSWPRIRPRTCPGTCPRPVALNVQSWLSIEAVEH